MKKHSKLLIIASAIISCILMAIVDSVIQPGYLTKSIIKLSVFMLLPFLVTRYDFRIVYFSLLRPKKNGTLIAFGIGAGLYILLLGFYFLIGPYFDFSNIADSLTSNAGITKGNFLLISLYISFINSFLEEFFFRGFVFTNLKKTTNKSFAYLFSAAIFSCYHIAMMIGWFSPGLFILVMAGLFVGGLIFNWLNEKLDTIYCSWLTHMFANFAINTIGFILLNKGAA